MPRKTKAARKARADAAKPARKRPSKPNAEGSAPSSAKAAPRGRPFEPGNRYRWQPGTSGNPEGSSKKQILSTAYRAVLEQPMPVNLKTRIAEMIDAGATVADICAMALVSGVLTGNVAAATELRKGTEGERYISELSGPNGGPIETREVLTDAERAARLDQLLQSTRDRRAALADDAGGTGRARRAAGGGDQPAGTDPGAQ